jgi:hypothetical protein
MLFLKWHIFFWYTVYHRSPMITCYILYVRVSSEQDRDIYIYKILYVRVTSEQDRDIYT